jgi:hypothetical protein
MTDPSDILLITGLPGTGKTRYTEWLEHHGWGCVRSDAMDNLLDLAIAGVDTPLLQRANAFPEGFVVEWGFPVTKLPELRKMIRRGYNAWYFDGDRDAALSGWRARWQGRPETDFHLQADSLEERRSEIAKLFVGKILETVRPGPEYLPEESIHQLIERPG